MKFFPFICSLMLIANLTHACGEEKKLSKDSFYNDKVEVVTMLKSGESWDGAKLPAYPAGEPEIQLLKITIPPKMKLPMHYHPVINTGVVMKGTLRITTADGKARIFKEGEAFNELVNTNHFGENMGDEPAVLYVYYVSEKGGKPLTVLVDAPEKRTAQ
jgi:quercetin dioxygenase-like cupin family protein